MRLASIYTSAAGTSVNTANQTSDFPSINDIKYLSCTYLSMCNEHANEEERQNGRAESSVWNLDAKMAS